MSFGTMHQTRRAMLSDAFNRMTGSKDLASLRECMPYRSDADVRGDSLASVFAVHLLPVRNRPVPVVIDSLNLRQLLLV